MNAFEKTTYGISKSNKWVSIIGLTLASILSLLYLILSPVVIFLVGVGPLIACALASGGGHRCSINDFASLAPFIAITSILTLLFAAFIATLFVRTTKISKNPLSLQIVSIIVITFIFITLPVIDVIFYIRFHIGIVGFSLSLVSFILNERF